MIWACWAALACGLAAGTTLLWPARILIAAAVCASVTGAIRTYVVLRGARAVRGLAWPSEDSRTCYLHIGPGRHVAATPAGCRRYGSALWWLCFETPEGRFRVMLDAHRQDPQAIRRLGRFLFRAKASARGRSGRADTPS